MMFFGKTDRKETADNAAKRTLADRKRSSADTRSGKTKQKNRPWYDISYDDMILYDIFDDE